MITKEQILEKIKELATSKLEYNKNIIAIEGALLCLKSLLEEKENKDIGENKNGEKNP